MSTLKVDAIQTRGSASGTISCAGQISEAGKEYFHVDLTTAQTGTVTPAAENKGNFKTGGMFRTNSQNLTIDTTILATENAQVTGTITVDSGVTLTVNSGGRLVIS